MRYSVSLVNKFRNCVRNFIQFLRALHTHILLALVPRVAAACVRAPLRAGSDQRLCGRCLGPALGSCPRPRRSSAVSRTRCGTVIVSPLL